MASRLKSTHRQTRKRKRSTKPRQLLPFDDCPICRAVNAADAKGRSLSERELLTAFAKAKDQQKRKR